jgi:D-serine deaminase-like pyridoxal phosphate-dependent protein
MDRNAFKNYSLPCAFLDWDAVEQNVQAVASRANGKRIRIASKSIRSVPVLQYILNSHPCYQGIMSYNPREAAYLAECGFDDILLGYPTMDAAGIESTMKHIKNEKIITFMVDHLSQIELLESLSKKHSVKVNICIDIDMSTSFFGFHFGVRRSPLQDPEDIIPLITYIKESPHLALEGIMGYEAQIAGVGDKTPKQRAKNLIISWLKKNSLGTISNRRAKIVETIQNMGLELRFVNGGGTGSIHSTGQENWVTEITVGSAFYAPVFFDYYHDFTYKPAIGFALPIVRKAADDIYTCAGGGYIGSGAVGHEKSPIPFSPDGSTLLPMEGAGEVQTPILYKGEESLQIGDAILFRPAKAGEIAERFPVLYVMKGNQIVDQYNTYRGDNQCFY